MDAPTLVDVLQTMTDPRSPRGRFHPLPAVLSLVVLAMLCGRTSLAGISRFGRLHGTPLAHLLGFRRGKTPTVSTLSLVLAHLDPNALEDALARWITARIGNDSGPISLDGKTLRGSRDGELPGQHLVAAYAAQHQAVLRQIRVDAKTNEHKAALELLGLIPLPGKVVVGDAMFCQRDLAQKVVDSGGDYVFVAKDNQPELKADIQAAFGFEDDSRAMAAAFSPGADPGAGRENLHPGRQGPRSTGASLDPGDDAFDPARPVGGPEARVLPDAGADGEGEEDGGGGVRNHEFERVGSEPSPTGEVAAEPLADREWLALRA